ncbi:MAG: class II aldolase/adducin family protein [Chloroflexi bacterium]|nr:class II aldolase/adducin family protein [Chloroflexota bacterium]
MDTAMELAAAGLVSGSSGNVSVRLPGPQELFAITPLGKPLSGLGIDDIVVADFDIEPVEGELTPSSETLLHVSAYRSRPDVGAVIHTHSLYASVAAVAGLEIPPLIDEMVMTIGGPIRLSRYAFPGTQVLADNVLEALGDRNAALIRNHGAVGVGRDLREALDVCSLVERAAQIYLQASLLGKVNVLPIEVIETQMELFRMRRKAEDTS